MCTRSWGLKEEQPESHLTSPSVSQKLGQLCHREPKPGHSNTGGVWFFWKVLRQAFLSSSESETGRIVCLDPWLYGGIAPGKRNGESVQRVTSVETASEKLLPVEELTKAALQKGKRDIFYSSGAFWNAGLLLRQKKKKGRKLKGLNFKQLKLNVQSNPAA